MDEWQLWTLGYLAIGYLLCEGTIWAFKRASLPAPNRLAFAFIFLVWPITVAFAVWRKLKS